jgi:putative ATP-dependent endonuclease of OLD family
MPERSKLVRMHIVNIGPIGPEGLTVELDNIVCLVGANNTGKSTVLRAYELALGTERFVPDKDLCKRGTEQRAFVEMWVHIPKGTANIAEKWKTQENGLLLVRSRWEWTERTGWALIRQTWDPEIGDYSTEDKASGLDTVFGSRLPQPFRIGTLEEPEEEHRKFLTLILQPVADRLKACLADGDSALNKALADFNTEAQVPVREESSRLDTLKEDLNRSHNAIFPDLQLDFEIGIGQLDFDPVKLLLKSSHIKFLEWTQKIDWSKQGTGSQRALFWTMLQVRSRLNAIANIKQQTNKQIADCEKQIAKLRKEAENVKKAETKLKKEAEIGEIEEQLSKLRSANPEKVIEEQSGELALPGYMLLIDEPEVALHPNAIRAASGYLYGLADDPAWQVMLSTHSPQFIDPLKDHTTIVRLDRTKNNPTPRTYRSDDVHFTDNEKDNLKMLNRFDTDLSEMFFGQHPVLVEGDTEFAAFQHVMHSDIEKFPIYKRPVLVRARGKYTLSLIIRILKHFKVSFSILHDVDWPKRNDGKQNSAWQANESLHEEIQSARAAGLRVVHRVSVPTFELVHLPIETSEDGRLVEPPLSDKPWNMVAAVKAEPQVRESVASVLCDLTTHEAAEEPFDGEFQAEIVKALNKWVRDKGVRDNRFAFHE